MKKLLLFSFAVCYSIALTAQEQPLQVQVFDKNGKAYKNVEIYVKNPLVKAKVDRNGEASLTIGQSDTLYVQYGNTKALIPLHEQKKITVCIEKDQAYEILDDQSRQPITTIKTPSFSASDLQKTDLSMYRDLYDLLDAKFSSIKISNGEIFLPGTETQNGGKVPALIVLNGSPMANMDQVNGMIPIFELKSIEILNTSEATIYGMRGIGGVIEIKTIDKK